MRLSRRRRRTLAIRFARFLWRCLRIVLLLFVAMGPAPPPPPLPRPPAIEQRDESDAGGEER